MRTRGNAHKSLTTESDDESLIGGAQYRHTQADDSVTLEYRDYPLQTEQEHVPEPVLVNVERDMAAFDGNESSSRRTPVPFKQSAVEDQPTDTPTAPFAPRTFGSFLPTAVEQNHKRKKPLYAPPIGDDEVQELGLYERVHIEDLSLLAKEYRYTFANMVAAQAGIRPDQLYRVRSIQREQNGLDDLSEVDETEATADEEPQVEFEREFLEPPRKIKQEFASRQMSVSGRERDFSRLVNNSRQTPDIRIGVLFLGPTLTSSEELALNILKDQYPADLANVQLNEMEQSADMRPIFALLVASYVNMSQYVGARRAPHVTDYSFYGQRAKRAIERFRDVRYTAHGPVDRRVWIDRDATIDRRERRQALAPYCITQSNTHSSQSRSTRALFSRKTGYRPFY